MFSVINVIRSALSLLVLFSITTTLSAAPDYAREQRWADEITPSILAGDPVYLEQANGHKFLGIYTTATNPKMGIVVVHGMGLNPEAGFISSIRQKLVNAGYSTLSIQMPVLGADASYKDYPALFPDAVDRLKLAVAFLKQRGYERIAIVSHSNGSRMTRTYMITNPPEVITWVALSLTRGDTFKGVNVPVLDLYGEEDLSHVLESTKTRKKSFKNAESQQMLVPGGDHFYTGHEESMITAVRKFLDEITKPKITGKIEKCF